MRPVPSWMEMRDRIGQHLTASRSSLVIIEAFLLSGQRIGGVPGTRVTLHEGLQHSARLEVHPRNATVAAAVAVYFTHPVTRWDRHRRMIKSSDVCTYFRLAYGTTAQHGTGQTTAASLFGFGFADTVPRRWQ